MRTQPVLVDGLLEVLLQLGLLGVGAGPVVRLERVRVEVRADVDLGARVGVVPPGAADAERRLVDGERVDAGVLHLHAGGDAAEPGADDHDPRRARGSEQLLRGWGGDDGSRVPHELDQVAVGIAHVDARGLDAARAATRAPALPRRPRRRRAAARVSSSAEPSHRRQKSPHGGVAAGARSVKSSRVHISARWKFTIWSPRCTTTRCSSLVDRRAERAVERRHRVGVAQRERDVVEARDRHGHVPTREAVELARSSSR